MIVKIQKPLSPPPPQGQALVYDESRDFTAYMKWSECKALFGKRDLKVYVMATFDEKSGKLFLGARLKDQPW